MRFRSFQNFFSINFAIPFVPVFYGEHGVYTRFWRVQMCSTDLFVLKAEYLFNKFGPFDFGYMPLLSTKLVNRDEESFVQISFSASCTDQNTVFIRTKTLQKTKLQTTSGQSLQCQPSKLGNLTVFAADNQSLCLFDIAEAENG